ncbi:MAG TPA: lysophospholipid acyltransferase family protein [Steroidobacteraceae bacterium]|nr:lysophospholipid acyltransferase family protein [Steroidobacteraceae bacterium]
MGTLDRAYRTCATGFCFATFGAGGLAIALVVLPLLFLIPRAEQRHRLARILIRQLFRFFVALMSATGVLRLTVHDAARLGGRGRFILANHPSLIDVVILMSLVEQPDCIVKSALWRNPFTWGAVKTAGFIDNQTGPELVAAALDSLRAGNNLIVFPEGTRTRPGAPLSFQRGAANIAARGRVDLTPVIFTVSEPTLTKGYPWYRVPRRRPQFSVHVLPVVPIEPLLASEPAHVHRARWLTEWLEEFFTMEIARHGPPAG